MHPHFEFKLRFLRELDGPLNDQVSKPLIGIPLIERNTLVIQLPSEVHPAHRFIVYLTVSKIIIAIIMLILFLRYWRASYKGLLIDYVKQVTSFLWAIFESMSLVS